MLMRYGLVGSESPRSHLPMVSAVTPTRSAASERDIPLMTLIPRMVSHGAIDFPPFICLQILSVLRYFAIVFWENLSVLDYLFLNVPYYVTKEVRDGDIWEQGQASA